MQQQGTPVIRARAVQDRGTRSKKFPVNPFPARATVLPDPRVVLVDGYGFKIGVRDNMLCVSQNGNEIVYPQVAAAKKSNGLARLVVFSDDGVITARAFAWLRRNDVAVIHCNREGNSNYMSGVASGDARLYREQVLSQEDMPHAAKGFDITRDLLAAKIAGQHEVLKTMGASGIPRIGDYMPMLSRAKTRTEFLAVEGNVARHYWQSWEANVFVPWRLSSRRVIPSHWYGFNGRNDGYKTRSNQGATDFVNAMLNMAYKFGEIECMFACHTFGLHPGIGISHGQTHDNLPAMALDLLEPCRPVCDSVVLSYMECGHGQPMGDDGRPFFWTKNAAMEADGGICRLNKEVVYKLASAVSMAVAPHAMRWAEMIAKNLAVTDHISLVAPFDPRIREREQIAELAPDVTPNDLIPDVLWARIESLIPLRPSGYGPPIVNPRGVLASVVAHELYGVAWPKAAKISGVTWQKCKNRFTQWQESGTWEKIRAEVTKPGVSPSEDAGSL